MSKDFARAFLMNRYLYDRLTDCFELSIPRAEQYPRYGRHNNDEIEMFHQMMRNINGLRLDSNRTRSRERYEPDRARLFNPNYGVGNRYQNFGMHLRRLNRSHIV
jgi:hypothetical protein